MATEENYRNVLENFYTTPSQRNENYTHKFFNGLDLRMAIFLRQANAVEYCFHDNHIKKVK